MWYIVLFWARVVSCIFPLHTKDRVHGQEWPHPAFPVGCNELVPPRGFFPSTTIPWFSFWNFYTTVFLAFFLAPSPSLLPFFFRVGWFIGSPYPFSPSWVLTRKILFDLPRPPPSFFPATFSNRYLGSTSRIEIFPVSPAQDRQVRTSLLSSFPRLFNLPFYSLMKVAIRFLFFFCAAYRPSKRTPPLSPPAAFNK